MSEKSIIIFFTVIILGGLIIQYRDGKHKREMKKYAIERYKKENTEGLSIKKINENHKFCYFINTGKETVYRMRVIDKEPFNTEGYYQCLILGEEEYKKLLKERAEKERKSNKEHQKFLKEIMKEF